MEEQILRLLGAEDYAPANVPELLRLLRLAPNRQQELQAELRVLEQAGRIVRTKGNRYIAARDADLIPGRIQINRQGKGFLQPDDAGLPTAPPPPLGVTKPNVVAAATFSTLAAENGVEAGEPMP